MTSSPFNTGRRAPTLYEDEPSRSSYYSSGRALHCTSHRRAPPHETHLTDEPIFILQADGLPHSVLIDELSFQHRQTSSYYSSGRALHCTSHRQAHPLLFLLTSSPFNTGRRAPTIHQGEPFTVLHTDGLLPTKLISQTSRSLYFKQTGSLIQFSLTSSPFNTGRRAPTIHQGEPFTVLHTDGLLPTKLISQTSPSLYFKQTGSLIQFSLTSSSFNTGRRAPTIHQDEPFTVLHTDRLLPTIPINELSLQHRPTSSYYSSGRALHCTSHRRAPPHYSY